MNIELAKIDKLNEIVLDLTIITYLNRLVLNEYEIDNETYSPIKVNQSDVYNYISDLQINCIKELQKLIYDKHFTK